MKTGTMVGIGVGVLAAAGAAYYFWIMRDEEETPKKVGPSSAPPADLSERISRSSAEAGESAARGAQAYAEWKRNNPTSGILNGI